MKSFLFVLVVVFFSFTLVENSFSSPLDLSGFTADEGVVEANGVISFVENENAAMFFFNDSIVIDQKFNFLVFDYDFFLGPENNEDYIQFNINHTEIWWKNLTGSGSFFVNLSEIMEEISSIDWAFLAGDYVTGSYGSISNVQLMTSLSPVPVPEPSSAILVSFGFLIFVVLKKRKIF